MDAGDYPVFPAPMAERPAALAVAAYDFFNGEEVAGDLVPPLAAASFSVVENRTPTLVGVWPDCLLVEASFPSSSSCSPSLLSCPSSLSLSCAYLEVVSSPIVEMSSPSGFFLLANLVLDDSV